MNNTLEKENLQASLKPSFITSIEKFNMRFTNRKSAINLMTALEKVWTGETFAVLPAGKHWRLCNYNLLSRADQLFIDVVRTHESYYE